MSVEIGEPHLDATQDLSQRKKAGGKPPWLKVSYNPAQTREVLELMKRLRLNTVCQEANCPNLGHCYQNRTATFMILGNRCTRNCRFCDVIPGHPEPVDETEPIRLAEAAVTLGLKHVVVTSVTRDDLPDGGSAQFVAVIRTLREKNPQVTIEVLIPDFQGKKEALRQVFDAHPDVLNHNVETVPSLYSKARPQAVYQRSLQLLSTVKQWTLEEKQQSHRDSTPPLLTKTGIMLGLGETEEELVRTFEDLAKIHVDILTLGQYLQPTPNHLPVQQFVTPEQFDYYQKRAYEIGIPYVVSGPLVRSSYRAEEAFQKLIQQERSENPKR